MEYGIVNSDLKGGEIKPDELLANYVSQVEKDNPKYFPKGELKSVACPACGGQAKGGASAFEKCGLSYQTCKACHTLFVSPRPSQARVVAYFRESDSRRYWLKEIWRATADSRRTKVIEPLLDWMEIFLAEAFPGKKARVAEVYPNHTGLSDAARLRSGFASFELIEPLFPSSAATTPLSTQDRFDAVCLPHSLCRVADPASLLAWSSEHTVPGGRVFITSTLSTGLDILELGQRSGALIPPDHLNAFSYEGMNLMLKNYPFEVIEFSTPGLLDVENLKTATAKDPSLLSPFFEYVLGIRQDPQLVQSLQDFLQVNRLSSQARIVLKKTESHR